ncbi:MAG TPA: hypothetical protein VJC11_01480 [Patescibacteria group bacterium]|nr:hypothetical protein [Patescibacteria group bacterium]
MQFKPPKDDHKYKWTQHVQQKMMYYGISESLIKRISRFPKRSGEGIAPGTIAAMQPTSNKKKPQEIWVMYQKIGDRKLIISAWRYPGISPVGKKIPIPDDIAQEIENMLK